MNLLRSIFGGLVFVLVMALVFWIVYSNDELVPLRLVGVRSGGGIPLPFGWSGLPQGLWYVLFALLGLICGLLLGWIFSGPVRRQTAQQRRRASRSEQALAASIDKIDQARDRIDSLEHELKTQQQSASAGASFPSPNINGQKN